MNPAAVAIIATLDTKDAEAAFLGAELRSHGYAPRVLDVGLRSAGVSGEADVSGEAVAKAAGSDLLTLRDWARRDEAMEAMGVGAARILDRWHARGELAGVLGIGGNQGTAIAAGAMRGLPFGVPKVIVSTVASGNVRGFIGDSDITLMFSIGDLLGGPNPVTAAVLHRAAAAVAGMASAPPAMEETSSAGPLVAVTAFGNTHTGVTAAIERLGDAGVRTVPFHASGASGSAMERLIDEGLFDGVLDLTTHELLAELYPADVYAPVRPGRLTAAGRNGLPQVIAPGGLDYHCFAAADTIPENLRDRAIHHHNPNNTNVRAAPAELQAVAHAMAQRLNAATGPAAVLVPLRGWSEVGSSNGVLHDPAADTAFITRLRDSLSAHVSLRELDNTINDRIFAITAADTLLDFLNVSQPLHVPEQQEVLHSRNR